MSSLTFSRIVSTCRLVSTLKKSFHPFSSTHHSHIYSISAVPDIPDKTKVERDEESQWSDRVQHAMASIESQAQLNSYSGRTVSVTKNLGDSLRVLDGILARNKVKSELRSTERHEKKGVKRRRLASERWRNNFANEVRRNVQLVMKMRNRGA